MGAPHDPLIGRVVSHYRLVEKLGAGGMGAVYVADDEALGRRVAIKAIRHGQGSTDHMRERFQREARLLSRLDHPNICRIYDYIAGEDEDFLVLELIEGRTLTRYAEQRVERSEALRIGAEIAQALVTAHGQAIVHRDLKPANTMITDGGVVKVLDFGLARPTAPPGAEPSAESALPAREESAWSSVEATLTEVGTVSGTLRYMSPEQARAEPLTTASDVYSLGLMLQELLSGERAYPPGLTPVEQWELAKQGRAIPFTSGDRELRELVEAMKARAASERPTALDVSRAIVRLRGRPRRRLAQILTAAAVLAVAGGVTKYVVDLDEKRGQAIEARNEATRRRDQAQELLGFLVGDLREKLEPLGRLDVLDEVGIRAQAYFDAVPEALLSDTERIQQSKLLYQIGEIRRLRGDLPAARELYKKSLQAVEQVTSRDPENLEWLLARGASQFYMGVGFLDQGDFDQAEFWLEEYRTTSEEGARLSGRTQTWRMEVAYAYHNLGVLEWRRRAFSRSLEFFEDATDRWRELMRDRPQDSGLQLELADVISWLGNVQLKLSRYGEESDSVSYLDAARASFTEEYELRTALQELEPENANWKSQMATVESYLGRVEQHSGRVEQAGDHYRRATEIARKLCELDPSNAEWRLELASHERRTGSLLLVTDRPVEAEKHLRAALELLEELVRSDPTNKLCRGELELVNVDIAEVETALALSK